MICIVQQELKKHVCVPASGDDSGLGNESTRDISSVISQLAWDESSITPSIPWERHICPNSVIKLKNWPIGAYMYF